VVGVVSRLAQRARLVLPELTVPCFAHLRVRAGGRSKDLLLGPQTSVGPEVTNIDSSTARRRFHYIELATTASSGAPGFPRTPRG